MMLSNGRGRLTISEHRDSCHVSLDIDGAGVSMFLDADQCMKAAGEILAIARRIRRRG